MTALSIKVFDTRDNERLAFQAESGRGGFARSAELDFLHFASVEIGAVYVVLDDAAERLVSLEARVVIQDRTGERVFGSLARKSA